MIALSRPLPELLIKGNAKRPRVVYLFFIFIDQVERDFKVVVHFKAVLRAGFNQEKVLVAFQLISRPCIKRPVPYGVIVKHGGNREGIGAFEGNIVIFQFRNFVASDRPASRQTTAGESSSPHQSPTWE